MTNDPLRFNQLTIESFLEMMIAQFQASKNTQEAYQRDLVDFSCTVNCLFENITKNQVDDYFKNLNHRHLSAATIARRLSAIKRLYQFLIEEGRIHINILQSFESPKKSQTIPTVMTKEEVLKLITSIAQDVTPRNARLAALLEMLYSTGLRVSELLTIPLRSLTIHPKNHTLSDTLLITGKGNKERIVHLNNAALQSILLYLEHRPYFLKQAGTKGQKWLFPSRSQEGHLTRQRFGQLLKEQALIAGISPDLVHPHALRHAFATHLLQNGADLLVIQKLLGHSDISTTQIYTHVLPIHLQELLTDHHPLHQKK